MLKHGQAKRIVLARPAVEAGERLGFLPGDLQAKVNPYLRPLFDALHDMMDFEQVKRFMVNDVIEVIPLAFMRGRTLNDSVIILDEAQNTTAVADADVPDAAGPRLEDDRHRRHEPGRPARGRSSSGLVDAVDKLRGIKGIGAGRAGARRHRPAPAGAEHRQRVREAVTRMTVRAMSSMTLAVRDCVLRLTS